MPSAVPPYGTVRAIQTGRGDAAGQQLHGAGNITPNDATSDEAGGSLLAERDHTFRRAHDATLQDRGRPRTAMLPKADSGTAGTTSLIRPIETTPWA